MKRIAVLMPGVLLALATLGVPKSEAQVDLAKALIGKWAGEVQQRGTGGDPNRTLIIEAVTQTEGKWVAQGKYGMTGKGLGRVQMEVDAGGGKPWVRFVTAANLTVRLDLFDEKHLVGKVTLAGARQQDPDRAIRLEKVD